MDSFATRGSLKTLKFFADVDLNAVQLCPVPIQHRRDRAVLLGKEIPARFPTSRIAELTVGPTDAVRYGAHHKLARLAAKNYQPNSDPVAEKLGGGVIGAIATRWAWDVNFRMQRAFANGWLQLKLWKESLSAFSRHRQARIHKTRRGARRSARGVFDSLAGSPTK